MLLELVTFVIVIPPESSEIVAKLNIAPKDMDTISALINKNKKERKTESMLDVSKVHVE